MPSSPSSLPSSTSERSTSEGATADAPVLRVRGLTTRIGGQVLHRDLSLDLYRGEVLALVGASGSGKSVLLRTLLGLRHPAEGTIEAWGQNFGRRSQRAMRQGERRWGVLI